MLFEGAKVAFTASLCLSLWLITGTIWFVSDLSPLESAKNQIQIMNEAYGD